MALTWSSTSECAELLLLSHPGSDRVAFQVPFEDDTQGHPVSNAQETLVALLYKDGRFQFSRLESLLSQASRAPGRSALSRADADGPRQGSGLELLLSPGVAFVRSCNRAHWLILFSRQTHPRYTVLDDCSMSKGYMSLRLVADVQSILYQTPSWTHCR